MRGGLKADLFLAWSCRAIFIVCAIAFANEFAPTESVIVRAASVALHLARESGTSVDQIHRVIVLRGQIGMQPTRSNSVCISTVGANLFARRYSRQHRSNASPTSWLLQGSGSAVDLLLILILGAPSNHAGRKPILIRRANRHGCRFSRAGPGMALRGGPPNQCRVAGMPSLGEGPSGGAQRFWLLFRRL